MNLFMGNFSTSKVVGKGTVKLKFTSGKVITLKNVLHMPYIHKNLVSRSLLSKHGFKMVFESEKLILTSVFVEKGYSGSGKGLVKPNVD